MKIHYQIKRYVILRLFVVFVTEFGMLQGC
jgi:hypothetical protein